MSETFLGDGDECICVFSMVCLYPSSARYRLYSRWNSNQLAQNKNRRK